MESIRHRVQRFINGLSERYEPYIQMHLADVYTVLGLSIASALLGIYLQTWAALNLGHHSQLVSFVCATVLHSEKYRPRNDYVRLALLMLLSFSSAQAMDPVISYITDLNATLARTLFITAIIIFCSLSLAALLAERGQFLALGTLIARIINIVSMLSVLNMFLESKLVKMIQVGTYLCVSATAILFDTHFIIEMRRDGNQDVIQPAFDLIFDILTMYRCMLLVGMQKEERLYEKRLSEMSKSARFFGKISNNLLYIFRVFKAILEVN